MSNSDITIPTTDISLNSLFTDSNYTAFTGSYVESPANQANFSKMRAAKYDSSNTNPFSIGTELKGKKVGLINSIIKGNNIDEIFFNISNNEGSSNINDYLQLPFSDNISPIVKEYPLFYEEQIQDGGDLMEFVIDRNSSIGNLQVLINNTLFTNYTYTQFQSPSFPPTESRFKVDFDLKNQASDILSTTEPLNIEFSFN